MLYLIKRGGSGPSSARKGSADIVLPAILRDMRVKNPTTSRRIFARPQDAAEGARSHYVPEAATPKLDEKARKMRGFFRAGA
jgi:hypothetical protein